MFLIKKIHLPVPLCNNAKAQMELSQYHCTFLSPKQTESAFSTIPFQTICISMVLVYVKLIYS